ncbi:MAG: hypothetical protein A2V52_08530 [Actinobacteria bacterium RBG_19FT_COMBO_54_7]|uniref:HTH tetR-type domain-containing protein n=1 Tax=Candidatus Solincola sediminis TaxID=1797199 RepID=A0A1F2WKA8_9ACTN|nr:MAG: hypothetical protein A2Y75_07620 [Candidatus Solincola sediminis]OFW58813.1 MAG: hypothetical protein A2W01_01695 [Candidatus Solincola sediminis]OFW66568.1 MAG: hypothetical protein A2V52_08530 [Actinobacteria bacterium RBG_19FT_COMBO_54_7]
MSEAVPGRVRQARGDLTRKRIVDSATNLIYEKGYAATTVDDVIRQADATKGSFYHHFSSKEELGRAVIDNASSYIAQRIGKVLDRERSSPLRRIEIILGEIQRIVESAGCERGCIIGNLALEMSQRYEEFRAGVAEVFKSWSSSIASQLDEMKAAGLLSADFDGNAYADFAIAAVEGGIMMSKLTRDPSPMRNSISFVLETLRNLSDR